MPRDQSEDRPAPKFLVQYVANNEDGVSGYEVVRASDRVRVSRFPLSAAVASEAALVLEQVNTVDPARAIFIKRAAKMPVHPQFNLRGTQINPTAMPGPSRS